MIDAPIAVTGRNVPSTRAAAAVDIEEVLQVTPETDEVEVVTSSGEGTDLDAFGARSSCGTGLGGRPVPADSTTASTAVPNKCDFSNPAFNLGSIDEQEIATLPTLGYSVTPLSGVVQMPVRVDVPAKPIDAAVAAVAAPAVAPIVDRAPDVPPTIGDFSVPCLVNSFVHMPGEVESDIAVVDLDDSVPAATHSETMAGITFLARCNVPPLSALGVSNVDAHDVIGDLCEMPQPCCSKEILTLEHDIAEVVVECQSVDYPVEFLEKKKEILRGEPCLPTSSVAVDDDVFDVDALQVDGSIESTHEEEVVMVSQSVVSPPVSDHFTDEVTIVVNNSSAPHGTSRASGSGAVDVDAPPGDITLGGRNGVSKCSACEMSLACTPGSDVLVVSRCRHTLCVLCCVRAVADMIVPYPANTKEETNTRCVQAGSLKAIATCPARRCQAPLSKDEARTALAPSIVDSHFTDALEGFKMWMDAGATLLATDYQVVLPSFSSDMAAAALRVEGSDEQGEWFTDDFRGAYAPFWLYEVTSTESPTVSTFPSAALIATATSASDACGANDDMQPSNSHAGAAIAQGNDDKSVVAWLCAACGLHESPDHGRIPSTDPDSPPLYVHCALVRAYGAVLSLHGFARATESAEMVSAIGSAAAPKNKRATNKRKAKMYVSAASAKRSRKAVPGFAKGTGYGGAAGHRAEWAGLSRAFLEQTARADAAAAYWLSRIRCFLLLGANDPAPSWPGYMRSLLRNCGLMNHLSRILVNESIMDVGGRVPLFVAALRVVNACTDIPSLRDLVTDTLNGAQGRSIANLVDSLSKQASLLSSGAGVENLDAKTSLLVRQIRRSMRGINRHGLSRTPGQTVASAAAGLPVDENGVLDLEASVDAPAGQPDGRLPPLHDLTSPVTQAEKTAYVEAMRNVQFATVPGLAEKSVFFKDAVSNAASGDLNRGAMMRRVASEVASLFSSLPLDWSSTIVLRVDEDRYDFLRACICGPDDTPYDSGVFVFDIHLPSQYPQKPPKFHFLTTGGGRVRFNPNLYNNGKVCLSLLGTWAGPTWTEASTLLQVLVSIQSLILVDQPYFNEPGYESSLGTEKGKTNSEMYNAQVRRDNVVHAMLDNLRYSSNEMRSAIQTHFRMKRRAISRMAMSWFPGVEAPSALYDKVADVAQIEVSRHSSQAAMNAISSEAIAHMNSIQPIPSVSGLVTLPSVWAQVGQLSVPGIPSTIAGLTAHGLLGVSVRKTWELTRVEYKALMTELAKL
jgi:ubiquitin-protein ligase